MTRAKQDKGWRINKLHKFEKMAALKKNINLLNQHLFIMMKFIGHNLKTSAKITSLAHLEVRPKITIYLDLQKKTLSIEKVWFSEVKNKKCP